MISEKRQRWLPDSALKNERARETIARCVAHWSDDWIAQGRIEATDNWRCAKPSLGFVETRRKDGVGVTFRPDRDRRLAGMLIGRNMTSKDLRTEQDIRLIDRLIERAITGLLDALCKAFPSGANRKRAESAGEESFELALMPDRKSELIIVSVDRANLTEFALKNARPPREKPGPEARAAALSDQSIQISALVGRTRLELAELVEIGVGDVLVLDRPVTTPLDLTIDNRARGPESASLSLENDRLTLSIERTADQW